MDVAADGAAHLPERRAWADLFSITMNKFLRKKSEGHGPSANEDALNALSRPTSPMLKKSATSRWKKSKKQPETRPQLDLSIALPSSDNFRTSLLMPGLSTRFSMLREQDDPTSLLGKASDDSVLHPRRKSRIADFGYGANGLSAIAEVSSMRGSIRPPFARDGREHSFVSSEDGYASDAEAHAGGMMSRSRPGEGNILFGGRQKVYKIPMSGSNSGKSRGKLVYNDDVGVSAFQRYRMRDREEDESQLPRASDESQAFDFGLDKADPDDRYDDGHHSLPNDSAKDLSHSPSLSSNDRKRSTTSSDARSIARSSTAATSIASQPIASAAPSPAHAPTTTIAPVPASAPLLDRTNTKARRLYEQGLDQHLQDQQSSAMTRLNSIQRQRATSGKNTGPLLHTTKSAGNLQERPPQPVYALRNNSPPLTSPLPQLNTYGLMKHGNSATSSPVTSGPQSPIDSHMDESSVLAQALEPGDRGKATALGAFNKPAHAFDESQYLERQKALQKSASRSAAQDGATPSTFQQRSEKFESDESEQDTVTAVSQKPEPSRAYNVFQNAVNLLSTKSAVPPANKSPLPDTHRTFFGNISASEDEEDEEEQRIAQSFNQPEYGYGGYHSKWQPTVLPSVSEHPALRGQKSKASIVEEAEEAEEDPELPKQRLSEAASARSLKINSNKSGAEKLKGLDSPTLGPEAVPLNGMMQHLRQGSNHSSIYPPDDPVPQDNHVPQLPDMPWPSNKNDKYDYLGIDTRRSTRGSHYTASNPWDLDEAGDMSPVEPRANEPPQRQSDSSIYDDDIAPAHQPVDGEGVRPTDVPAWQQELRKQHVRDVSNGTLQERDAFSRELAARREAVKENLKSVVDTGNSSRGGSPVPGSLRAFGMMRAKNSRESLGNQSSKALRTLGVTSQNSSTSNLTPTERSGYSMDLPRPRNNSSPRPPVPPTAHHPAFKNEYCEASREDSNEFPWERQRASSRAQQFYDARSRSNSATTTGRSRSRTGPRRDDGIVDGFQSNGVSHEPTPEASPAILSSSRSSNGSRAGMQTYFDQKNGIMQGSPQRIGPLPPAPQQQNGYAPGRTPGSETNRSTPSSSSPTDYSPAQFSQTMSSGGRPGNMPRKKTISKSDISEPTLISSTSNVDTVELPEGASLKNGLEIEAPPIPPINPRRRGTRKLFGLGPKEHSDKENRLPQATQSDSNLLYQTSPKREPVHFPPSNVVRMPQRSQDSDRSATGQHYGYTSMGSPERNVRGPTRTVTDPLEGSMF